MKIIQLPRGTGKTTRLLYESEWNQIPILCVTLREKEIIKNQAQKLGLKIPDPICVSEIDACKCENYNANFNQNKVLVDNGEWVLHLLLEHLGLSVEAATFTTEYDQNNNV